MVMLASYLCSVWCGLFLGRNCFSACIRIAVTGLWPRYPSSHSRFTGEEGCTAKEEVRGARRGRTIYAVANKGGPVYTGCSGMEYSLSVETGLFIILIRKVDAVNLSIRSVGQLQINSTAPGGELGPAAPGKVGDQEEEVEDEVVGSCGIFVPQTLRLASLP